MAAIKTDLVNGRDLKIGSVYIPNGESSTFCKITDVTTSKPGKHGSAKNIITARNIINGKNINTTFKDTDEKIMQVLDFNYIHKIVYSISDTEVCVNLETGECIYTTDFGLEAGRVKAALEEEKKKLGADLVDDKGQPLLIKYSELDESGKALVFWELLYSPVKDLQRYGITSYTS